MKQSVYIVLKHKKHPLGVTTEPIMAFTNLLRAQKEASLLKDTVPKTTFTVFISPLVK